MNPSYEDYLQEASDKMSPLIDTLGKKDTMDFMQFAERYTTEAKTAITLLELAWKVKPVNQKPAEAANFVLLCVLAQTTLKDYKAAHQWADYAINTFPNEEATWVSKLVCSQLEAVDWSTKVSNRNTWENGMMHSNWLGLAIGASSLYLKQRQFAEKIAYPSYMLAHIWWHKNEISDKDFESYFSKIVSIADQLEYTKNTKYWPQAYIILKNILSIDWNLFGDNVDNNKIMKMKMKIQVIIA